MNNPVYYSVLLLNVCDSNLFSSFFIESLETVNHFKIIIVIVSLLYFFHIIFPPLSFCLIYICLPIWLLIFLGLNEEGSSLAQEMTGWPARIAQHEMDHLNGKMFLDIMQPNTLMCTAWDRINREGGNIYVSYSPKKMFLR